MPLNTRLGRVVQGVRRWRSGAAGAPIPVGADLSDSDWRRLRGEIDDIVSTRGGPVAARRRARTVGLTYGTLSETGRRRFFEGLARHFDRQHEIVQRAIDTVYHAEPGPDRRRAENELRAALTPPRELLLRRFAGLDGGIGFLVEMREDLLGHRAASPSPELAALDDDLHRILESWFDVALLRLERLTWDSPASLLEKLIEYEAVHEIESWDDLRRRLGPGRRCFTFLHPGMPDDPLIFVEVALTKGMADRLDPLLERSTEGRPVAGDTADIEPLDESAFDTATFYSISNCHRGLTGVSLGDFLIKSVVEELLGELSGLKRFATLSPMPGFRDWVRGLGQDVDVDDPDLRRLVIELADSPEPPADRGRLEVAKPALLKLAAQYLLEGRRGSRTADPVAHFHLSNGARLERINWLANPSPVGWRRGLAMMVNYRYELRSIERNYDEYVGHGRVVADDSVLKLLGAKR